MKRLLLRVLKITALAILLIFIKFLPAHSSNFQDIPKGELVKNSDSIVVGKVLDVYCDWNNTATQIYTYVRFKVLNGIKGTEGGVGEITIKLLGGRVGDREMVVEGGARFKPGEKALLFLKKNSDVYSVYGLSLGKFRIIIDNFSGREIAYNPFSLTYSKSVAGLQKNTSESGFKKRVFLDTFIDEIKEELTKD